MLEGREEMGKCGWVGGGVERMVMKREEHDAGGKGRKEVEGERRVVINGRPDPTVKSAPWMRGEPFV